MLTFHIGTDGMGPNATTIFRKLASSWRRNAALITANVYSGCNVGFAFKIFSDVL